MPVSLISGLAYNSPLVEFILIVLLLSVTERICTGLMVLFLRHTLHGRALSSLP